MGFFVKFHYLLLLNNNYFKSLGVIVSEDYNYNSVLKTSIIALSTFLVTCFICRKYLLVIRDQNKFRTLLFFENCRYLFNKHYPKIYVSYFFLALAFIYLNFSFNIYSKGNISSLPPVIIFIFKYFLILGLPLIFLSILHFDILRTKKISLFLIICNLLESFFISLSLLSRNLILNLFPFFLGYFTALSKVGSITALSRVGSNRKANFKLFIALLILSVTILFSLFLVEKERSYKFGMINFNISQNIKPLLVDRWVGLDALASVDLYPNKNFQLLNLALREVDTKTLSFYDRYFIDSPYKLNDNVHNHFITVPGFIAFFYYPGSHFFLIIAVSLVTFFGFFIERLALELSFGNYTLSAFIANLVAYRFASFGYAPINTLIFFIILLLSLFGYSFFIRKIEGLRHAT